MSEATEGASPLIQSGADVVDQEIFGDVWAFIMDNYTENDAELAKAYIAMRAACAIIEKELDIKRMEVTVE